jgi:2-oxoglutarate dehydrogenase E1 component
MTPKSKPSNGTAVLDKPNADRERIFNAYRQWGYLEGDLDPLGFLRPRETPELEREGEYAREARAIYSSTIGVEINHIYNPERRRWVYEQMESGAYEVRDKDQSRILDLLTRADIFEQVMQQRYLGSKRFSLEGTTALIPLVDEVLDTASRLGAEELVMGMSHRGRLNVIAHVAQRPPDEIFAGFEDVDPRSVLGSGDVKYHMGATGEYKTHSGGRVHIHLVSNPSHLEAVDPVTVGRTRAKQDRTGEGGREKYLPLIVHGDAAFAGQGILAETMNYADLPGYTVGGTVHVIVNNLIGFTTSYTEEHSTRFAACIARRQSIPIFHVNGEDVDAVVRVARMATEYRYKFGTDVVIDLIGYRRHGHSEVDDPTITQPLLYKKIKEHPPLWEIYADDIGATDAQSRAEAIRAEFDAPRKKPEPSSKNP